MPDLGFEKQLQAEGFSVVAGIDEAGRGPLAGPVTAAAVVLPENYSHRVLTDSKLLSEKTRDVIYDELISNPEVTISSAESTPEEIDRINILRATWLAMSRAFEGIHPRPDVALIDGNPVKTFPAPHRSLVKGDSLSLSVAAASIIAKVERDRLMKSYAEKYPGYGFERHKGYGTKAHMEALETRGPCPIHRMSFSPVIRAAGRKDVGGGR